MDTTLNHSTNSDILKRVMVVLIPSIAVIILVVALIIAKFTFNIGVVCAFHEITGWDCPGCGGTRMTLAILQGEFYQAFRWNPFVFLTAPILAVVYMWQSYLFIFKNKLFSWIDKFLVGYAIALILFGILRNISMFSWLAPTQI